MKEWRSTKDPKTKEVRDSILRAFFVPYFSKWITFTQHFYARFIARKSTDACCPANDWNLRIGSSSGLFIRKFYSWTVPWQSLFLNTKIIYRFAFSVVQILHFFPRVGNGQDRISTQRRGGAENLTPIKKISSFVIFVPLWSYFPSIRTLCVPAPLRFYSFWVSRTGTFFTEDNEGNKDSDPQLRFLCFLLWTLSFAVKFITRCVWFPR